MVRERDHVDRTRAVTLAAVHDSLLDEVMCDSCPSPGRAHRRSRSLTTHVEFGAGPRNEEDGVRQIRVVDLVLISAISLVLGELARTHRVVFSATGWHWVAGLAAVAAVALGYTQYVRWLERRLAARRALAGQSGLPPSD